MGGSVGGWVGVCGCLWVSVGVCGCLWVSVGVCGCLWVSVGVCGCLWVSVGVCGCLCLWVSVCVRACEISLLTGLQLGVQLSLRASDKGLRALEQKRQSTELLGLV